MGKIGTKRDQVEKGGENWGKLGLSGTKWKQVWNTGKIGTKWDQVAPGGENWGKLGLSGTKWKQVWKTEKNRD